MSTVSEPWLEPLVLHGETVRLEPLSLAHLPALEVVAQDEELWRFMSCGSLAEPARLRAWAEAIWRDARGSLGFAIVDRKGGAVLGVSSYLEAEPAHLRVEIGRTFLSRAVWRTRVNSECKRLLLGHAFEALGCRRVQLKTDLRNLRSQRAIERLGAVREGVLRAHMVLPDGGRRDSVMYSIVDTEWPAVRARLDGFLAR